MIEIRILGTGEEAALAAAAPEVFDAPVDPAAAAVFLADPRHHLAVAIDDEVVVGFATGIVYLHPDTPEPELWIDEVGVAPSHRRRGLGARLIRTLLERGGAVGCLKAWVLTSEGNTPARGLFARCGAIREEGSPVLLEWSLEPSTADRSVGAEALPVTVREAVAADAESWLRMRHALWPDGSEEEHRAEIAARLEGRSPEPEGVLVAETEAGRLVGLAELSVRPCAEGCRASRVAYLEGWFVAPDARRRGVGRALVVAAEAWGRSRGCTEMASDTVPANRVSAAAHRALGFADAGMVLCFRKDL